MTDVIFVGGKTYMVTRSEGSQSTPGNYGTYNSGGSDDKRLLVTNFNASLKNNFIKIYTLGGGRNYAQVVPGKFESSGSYEFEVQNGTHLKYMLGSVTAGATATVDFDAVAITGSPTAALKSYVVYEADVLDSFSTDIVELSTASASDITHRFTGMKINQTGLKADTESPLHATVDWIAQKPTTTTGSASTPTATAYADVPQMFYRGQLLIDSGDANDTGTGTLNTWTDSTKTWTTNQWATNYVLIDGNGKAFAITSNTATALTVSGTPTTGPYAITPKSTYTTAQVIQCNSIDVTMTNNLEQYWSISNDTGRGIKYALEKNREYTLRLNLNFTNADQLGRFYTGATSGTTPTSDTNYTKFCVVLDYNTATSLGDNFKALRLVWTDVVFDEQSLPVDPKDIVKTEITAFASKCIGFFITSDVQ